MSAVVLVALPGSSLASSDGEPDATYRDAIAESQLPFNLGEGIAIIDRYVNDWAEYLAQSVERDLNVVYGELRSVMRPFTLDLHVDPSGSVRFDLHGAPDSENYDCVNLSQGIVSSVEDGQDEDVLLWACLGALAYLESKGVSPGSVSVELLAACLIAYDISIPGNASSPVPTSGMKACE